MRNHKFRFSSLIPSEWFHKLKNMTKLRKKHYPPPLPLYSLNTTKKRKLYSYDSKSLPHSSTSYLSNRSSRKSLEPKVFQISPRNSLHMIQQSKRKSLYKPSSTSSSSSSVSTGFNNKNIKVQPKQDSTSSASICDQKRSSSHFPNLKFSSTDIIMEMNQKDFKKKKFKETELFNSTEKACPASNQTKESRKTHHLSVKVNKKEKEKEEEDACRIQKKNQKTLVYGGRRSSAKSPSGIKLRVTSPRVQVSPRRSKSRSQSKLVLDSFAVIKTSVDPKKDFRESMVEMIQENNIRASQDLEDLLTCYLSLNSKEYHDLIIKVFVQIWLEVNVV